MLLSFLSLTLQSEWDLTPAQTANMTACVFAGSLVGTLTLGYLGDHLGRRPAFLLSTAIISLFGVFTAFGKWILSCAIIIVPKPISSYIIFSNWLCKFAWN